MTDEHDPITDALRASLSRHAADAPPGELLAERIILAADRRPAATAPRRRSWRTWALPLIAAGAVGAVVAAVAGIENYHPSAHSAPAAGSQTVTSPPPATPTASPATSSVAVAPPAGSSAASTGALHNVRVLDLTFVGPDDGWALASADCVSGGGRCTALLRTTDGTSWHGMSGAAFNVDGVRNCADPCVTGLRFATDRIGYAYGPQALYMTTDGGAHWRRQPGGALALETLNGDVIRVDAGSPSGCPGPCNLEVATAAIGSGHWARTPLGASAIHVWLSRGGTADYLLLTQNPAGGGDSQTSTLYRSVDGGRHWTAEGEPCPQAGGEVDSTALAAGGAARVAVLCRARSTGAQFVATSTGGRFVRRGAVDTAAALLTGDPRTVLVTGGSGLSRSLDGGRVWAPSPDLRGNVGFVGFESSTIGRAVSADGRAIWTTRDGGATWTPVMLP